MIQSCITVKKSQHKWEMETHHQLNVHADPLKHWDDPIPFVHGLAAHSQSVRKVILFSGGATHRLIEFNLCVRQASQHLLHLGFFRILENYLLSQRFFAESIRSLMSSRHRIL